jgi:hypothetical protein
MKANALNQVTFKITPHDFAQKASLEGSSAPLAPPSKKQEGQLPLLPAQFRRPWWLLQREPNCI